MSEHNRMASPVASAPGGEFKQQPTPVTAPLDPRRRPPAEKPWLGGHGGCRHRRPGRRGAVRKPGTGGAYLHFNQHKVWPWANGMNPKTKSTSCTPNSAANPAEREHQESRDSGQEKTEDNLVSHASKKRGCPDPCLSRHASTKRG